MHELRSMYIYLNTFISGYSGGLSTGSLLVGSQQVGPKGSLSTASMLWFISMGRRLCRTCVLLCNLQFNHCFSKNTSVLTGMPGTGRGR